MGRERGKESDDGDGDGDDYEGGGDRSGGLKAIFERTLQRRKCVLQRLNEFNDSDSSCL